MTPASGTSSASVDDSDHSNGSEAGYPSQFPWWTARLVLIKAFLLPLQQRLDVHTLLLIYALISIFSQKSVPKTSESVVDDEPGLESLLPEVKGRILERLDHEDIFKLKSLSKSWKALIDGVEFLQTLSLKAKPVLTACSFFIDKDVWQWVAYDSDHKQWRRFPSLTFLPPDCNPNPDLFKQYLLCANEGLVCMNFSKSPNQERLIVFNPLTGQWKELPPLLNRRNPVLMHMYVDRLSKSYHILVAGCSDSRDESLSSVTELFDSRTGQWERVGDFPRPAFALNEYQSGVFHHGTIFCIGFLELGDETVKGILGFDVEKRIWSTEWTDSALPSATILQLVGNCDQLFLFSERETIHGTEHWVDRVEWSSSEGDPAQKPIPFQLVNLWRKVRSGGRSLEAYPESALVPLQERRLCAWNTVERTGEVFDIEDPTRSEALPALPEGVRGELGLFTLNPITFTIELQFSSKV